MSKVVAYKNDDKRAFCQIRLDSGERILISIASIPRPGIKIMKLALGGLLPIRTVWEFNTMMAGGYSAYIEKMIHMFANSEGGNTEQPLDAVRDILLPCKSIDEVRQLLLEAERVGSNMQ